MWRDPVDAGAFHRHRFYFSLFEPFRHPHQFWCCRPEIRDFSTASLQPRRAHPVPLTADINSRYLGAYYGQPCNGPRTAGAISTLPLVPHPRLPFRTQLPRLAIRGFCPRGVLQEPHQCSIAFLEPCSKRGIRTNEKRALAAVAFLRSITRMTASHRLFNPGPPGGKARKKFHVRANAVSRNVWMLRVKASQRTKADQQGL